MSAPRPFVHDDFLLETPLACDLYHGFAERLPIFDYHCHLPAGRMASDHRFRSITELWLEGDHYKWRAMRANGVAERFCSGAASDWEKFEAWAAAVPSTLGNPLYHWTHMELRRPFGIETALSPSTAEAVFGRANGWLAEHAATPLALLCAFRVAVVCTTDDPTDSLDAHAALAARFDADTRVYPGWRPDKAVAIDDAAAWNAWIERLEAASGTAVESWTALVDALDARHAFFHHLGCRLSDHGLERLDAVPFSEAQVARTFERLRSGRVPGAADAAAFRSALLYQLALMDHGRGWVQQFHLGALRNTNTRKRRLLGADTGFDSIGDFEQAVPLARFLDRLDSTGQLARTVLYNLNPADNAVFATMIGNFQGDGIPGKMQWGPAWWFLDQLDGMETHLRVLAAMGLLARFIGMTTDSRSFLSYPRHEYFRRLLCGFLGEEVRRGRLPDDRPALGRLVADIAFYNARDYFGLKPGRLGQPSA